MSADAGDLARFAERTRELGLSLPQSDLLILFSGWQGIQSQLVRVRSYLDPELHQDKADRAITDGDR